MASEIVLNQKFIESYLFSVFIGVVEKSPDKRSIHRALQGCFAHLAKMFGMEAICEYRLKSYRSDGRDGFVDVVWISGLTLIVAIEIDSALRVKSIKKLLEIPARHKYWFYYGQKEPISFVRKYDPDNTIQVMHEPFSMVKGANQSVDRNYQSKRGYVPSSNCEVDSLIAINRHIHQAIQHCWETLSKEERSLEKLEQEMIRLVRRALQDIKGDVDAFSIGKPRERSPHRERIMKVRSQYPRAYEKWSKSDEEILNQMFSVGTSIDEISNVLQRQPGALRSRLKKLGRL